MHPRVLLGLDIVSTVLANFENKKSCCFLRVATYPYMYSYPTRACILQTLSRALAGRTQKVPPRQTKLVPNYIQYIIYTLQSEDKKRTGYESNRYKAN